MRVALAFAVLLVAASCGGGSSSVQPAAVSIVMRDNDFSRPVIAVKSGQTVTFTFVNSGKLVHEAFIGDDAAQVARGTAPEAGPEPAGGVLVKPGQTGTLTYTFDGAGTLIMGCHIAGHYEAGMHSRINVS